MVAPRPQREKDMQEDILLVPYQDLSQWPNDLHLQFNQTQDEQMDAEFDVDCST